MPFSPPGWTHPSVAEATPDNQSAIYEVPAGAGNEMSHRYSDTRGYTRQSDLSHAAQGTLHRACMFRTGLSPLRDWSGLGISDITVWRTFPSKRSHRLLSTNLIRPRPPITSLVLDVTIILLAINHTIHNTGDASCGPSENNENTRGKKLVQHCKLYERDFSSVHAPDHFWKMSFQLPSPPNAVNSVELTKYHSTFLDHSGSVGGKIPSSGQAVIQRNSLNTCPTTLLLSLILDSQDGNCGVALSLEEAFPPANVVRKTEIGKGIQYSADTAKYHRHCISDPAKIGVSTKFPSPHFLGTVFVATNKSPENIWLSDGIAAPLQARLSLLWDAEPSVRNGADRIDSERSAPVATANWRDSVAWTWRGCRRDYVSRGHRNSRTVTGCHVSQLARHSQKFSLGCTPRHSCKRAGHSINRGLEVALAEMSARVDRWVLGMPECDDCSNFAIAINDTNLKCVRGREPQTPVNSRQTVEWPYACVVRLAF
ncbi:hypothetical protein F5J12DRAFT_928263 [Pisolithus orientalis]|uniref:uncharacterized protein n=1 Tax=Pisolithus orientalis TaxID=936130 RepID=UPI002225235C|nr:uncharacterized protein F5J12DRAFT_928263 [Pisolithus orientalis]KAI6002289.1 hypothetical protein F5J12DRAFT_928263 [Pisolithus orientalis]